MKTLRSLATIVASLALSLGAFAASKSRYADLVLADKPVAYWRLNDAGGATVANLAPGKDAALLNGTVEGAVKLAVPGQKPEQFPDFNSNDGLAASFGEKAGHITVKDPGADSALDLKKGDSLTLEAWVSVNELKSGKMVYLISKGRTEEKGEKAQNQNYAMRLHGVGAEARLMFLFRDTNKPTAQSDANTHWHRWSSDTGFAPGSGWHHLVLTYTFGKGDSLRGYIDGEPVKGTWDMGGKSDAAPVVDDDDLWIGSAMGGKLDSTLNGQINEVAIYRKALSAAEVKKHFNFVPPAPPVFTMNLPKDAVRCEIIEGVPGYTWNFVAGEPSETWTEPAFGLGKLPGKYNARGVRADRTPIFLVRLAAKVKLPKGEQQLLLRAFNGSRLFVDGKQVATTPFPKSGGGGHNEVEPTPTNLPDGLRFLRAGHSETNFTVKGDGREKTLVLEVFVGGKTYRPEIGELTLSWLRKDGLYQLVAPKTEVLHTDDGWLAYAGAQRERLIARDAQRRREVATEENKYWDMRHELARRLLAKTPAPAVPQVSAAMPLNNEIDRFIGAKLEAAGVKPAPLTDDYAFLRRLTLDTVGVPPTPEQIQQFVSDQSRDRRAKAIARFLAEPGWADHWTSYWQDVLAENPGILKPTLNNTGPFRHWIHESLADNKPMDRFASELILMEGSVLGGGPGGFSMATQNDVPMADRATVLSQAFLAMNLACARCHDAPYHDFKQEQLFSMAAMLNRGASEVPASSSIPPNANIKVGRLVNVTLMPGAKVEPTWTFTKVMNDSLPEGVIRDPKDHREQLAAYVTDPRNARFAKVIVNRVWKRYLGWGFAEPVEDWETAKASHPELLDWLAREFATHNYDLKHLAGLILNSHTYQREAGLANPKSDEVKDRLFASPARRRLTAEQSVDSLFAVVGKKFDTEMLTLDNDNRQAAKDFQNMGYPRRAWEFVGFANDRDRPALAMPRAQAIVDVLGMFGWRDSRQSPLSARNDDPNVLQPAQLANGDMANGRITRLSDDAAITELAVKAQPLDVLIEQMFLRVLSRLPTAEERATFEKQLEHGYASRVQPAPPKSLKKPFDEMLLVSWSNHLNDRATEIKMAAENRARAGDEPTPRLRPDWRERMEDALWALVNSPEFVFVP